MGRAIVITSGKGGTGKTTTTASLGAALAQAGQRVLCIDGDVGLRNLDLSLGLSDLDIPDFLDVAQGRIPLRDAAVRHPDFPGLFLLSAPSLAAPDQVPEAAMAALLSEARDHFDFILLDSPAGIGPGFRLAARFADAAIAVSNSDLSSCRGVQRVVMELYDLGVTDVSLVVNRVRPRLFTRSRLNVDDIMDAAGARLLGLVPEDRAVILAANLDRALLKEQPADKKRGAAAAYRRIAARLLGQPLPLGDMRPLL